MNSLCGYIEKQGYMYKHGTVHYALIRLSRLGRRGFISEKQRNRVQSAVYRLWLKCTLQVSVVHATPCALPGFEFHS